MAQRRAAAITTESDRTSGTSIVKEIPSLNDNGTLLAPERGHAGLETVHEPRRTFPLQVSRGDKGSFDNGEDDYEDDLDDEDLEQMALYETDTEARGALLRDEHQRRHERRYQKWKGSPFAVGFTEATWMDERTRDVRDRSLPPDDTGCLCCSAQLCPLFGAGRVGNMAVLKQSVEWVEVLVAVDEEDVDHPESTDSTNGAVAAAPKMVLRRVARPRLDIVVGPYWPMLCGVTYPLIFGVSGWTLYSGLWHAKTPAPWWIWCLFVIMTLSLVIALACTGLRDPGILLRTRTLNPQLSDAATWRWSDLADSYKPRNAWYDSDTAVIVDGFDHTCPWTGTAIGRKNMFAFQMFVCLVFLCLIMDIFILTGTIR